MTQKVHKLDINDIHHFLPERNVHTHKGDYGRILLLCGSVGYTGAAALATVGALRTGAGVVYLGVPESIYAIEAAKLLESVVIPFPDQDGMFAEEAIEKLLSLIDKMDAVLIGPGIGQSEGTKSLVISVLKNSKCPVVLDADGINLMARHKDILCNRKEPTVLTPHMGEFLRLGGCDTGDRCADAGKLASELNCIVLLKGHHTVISDGHTYYINPTGNPGMAKGGSGDLLSGIIVSLLGQGVPPLEAAACGAWLHGAAGDICADEIGQYGMLPQDMAKVLPRLLK